MKERPIIMGAESVRAILAGTKTQTRRVVTPSPGRQREWCSVALLSKSPRAWIAPDCGDMGAQFEHPGGGPLGWVRCPYGAPGDRLWVKEAWQPAWDEDEYAVIAYRADGAKVKPKVPLYAGPRFFAAADEWTDESPWRSPLMMPRWASRLTLEVVSVRVERVQDISRDDAVAEGVAGICTGHNADGTTNVLLDPVAGYRAGWDAINAKRGFGWDANPWVWVVTFRRASDTTAPTRQKGE